MIQLSNVSKHFQAHTGETHTGITSTSLSIPTGQITGLIGPSGAGKSTLLRMINGLVKPDTGSVIIANESLHHSDHQRNLLCQKMGMIFQHFNLLNTLTVRDNIALPLRLRGDTPQQQRERVNTLSELCQISEHLEKMPQTLSGGQKQRVAIARALATQPPILLADEATSALDPESTQNILNLLMTLNEALGLTIVLVTHEMHVIKQICDQVVVLSEGKIIEKGPTLDIFLNPQHRITQGMVAQVLHTLLPSTLHIQSLYRIAYIGSLSSKPLLSLMTQQFGVTVNILQASIEPIKEQILGIMLVSLEGSSFSIEKGIAFLTEQGCQVEALHHVG
jgi:D-methionine transport system ATP-binding protein